MGMMESLIVEGGRFDGGGEEGGLGMGRGGGTSVWYLFSLSYKCLCAWRWRQRWPVHLLSCCSLRQCAGSRHLCGKSGQTGIFQLLPGVSGAMEEGGGCEGRSLS